MFIAAWQQHVNVENLQNLLFHWHLCEDKSLEVAAWDSCTQNLHYFQAKFTVTAS